MAVSEVLDIYVDIRKANNKTGRLYLKPLYEYFGSYPATSITKKMCRDYKTWRTSKPTGGKNWKPKSFRPPKQRSADLELAYLRSAINTAVNEDIYITENNSKFDIKTTQTSKIDKPSFSKEQARAFVDLAVWHLKLFLVISFQSGHRKQAVLELTWDRVDFRNRSINFIKNNSEETNKRRGVIFFKEHSELHNLLNIGYKRKTCDFVIEWNGTRVQNIKHAWDNTLYKLQRAHNSWDLRGLTPHSTKHTAILWQLKERVPMTTIALHTATDIKTLMKHYSSYDESMGYEAITATEF